MATRQELLIEANNRGLLSGKKKEMYDEAVRRGLIQDAPVQQLPDEALAVVQQNIPAAVSARDLPEIGDAPEITEFSIPGAKASLAALSITNPQELGQALSKQIPGTTITLDQEGNFVANFPSGSYAINKPGLSVQDIEQFIFRLGAFAPAASRFKAAIPAIVSVAGKSAGIESALQAGEAGLGGEFDIAESGLAALFGGVGESVVRGAGSLVRGILNRRNAQKAATEGLEAGGVRESAKAVQEAVPAQEATGVQLTKAQQTLDPFALQEQSYIADLPEGSKRALEELTQQNREAGTAVNQFIETMAPPEAVTRAGDRIRSASQKAIELKKLARREKTSPLYKQAFEVGADVDITPVLDDIELRLSQYPASHPAYKALVSFGEEVQENAADLQKLQGVKEVIDSNISSLIQGRPTAATNKATKEIVEVQRQLLKQMDEASPLYENARKSFELESGPVNEIKESILGKIADIDDTQLKNVSRRILDPAETNPDVIKSARSAIESIDGGYAAWNDMLRAEMERRLGSFRGDMDQILAGNTRAAENVPAKILSSLVPNDKARKSLMAAMDADQRKNFEFLETALRRASLGRPGGSQTGIRREISERFNKGVVAALRRFVSSPIETVAEIGEESARSNRIRAVADAVFDRTWEADLAAIRKLAISEAREEAFLELLKKTERAAGVATAATVQPIRAQE